jgi:membrane associated rhomboid family serine protease
MDKTLLIIIAANAIFSYMGFNDIALFNKYKFQIGAIKNGEVIRHITSGFLHADFQHLFFNMLTLYFFAPIVIATFGAQKFLLIYFASLLSGSALSYKYHYNENHYSAIGASGAVTGILYTAIMIYPQMTINFFIPGWLFAIGYMYYTIYGMKNQLGNIGHTAHLGGAIAGFALSLFLIPHVFERNLIFVILLALPILYLLFFEKRFNQ